MNRGTRGAKSRVKGRENAGSYTPPGRYSGPGRIRGRGFRPPLEITKDTEKYFARLNNNLITLRHHDLVQKEDTSPATIASFQQVLNESLPQTEREVCIAATIGYLSSHLMRPSFLTFMRQTGCDFLSPLVDCGILSTCLEARGLVDLTTADGKFQVTPRRHLPEADKRGFRDYDRRARRAEDEDGFVAAPVRRGKYADRRRDRRVMDPDAYSRVLQDLEAVDGGEETPPENGEEKKSPTYAEVVTKDAQPQDPAPQESAGAQPEQVVSLVPAEPFDWADESETEQSSDAKDETKGAAPKAAAPTVAAAKPSSSKQSATKFTPVKPAQAPKAVAIAAPNVAPPKSAAPKAAAPKAAAPKAAAPKAAAPKAAAPKAATPAVAAPKVTAPKTVAAPKVTQPKTAGANSKAAPKVAAPKAAAPPEPAKKEVEELS